MELRLRRLDSNKTIKILKAPSNGASKIWLGGRGTCCHIYTQSKYASRKHFSITYRENKYYISDLQSCNGTFLNDNKITCEKILSCGNVISVGVPSNIQNTHDVISYVSEIHSIPVEEPVICIIDEDVGNCEKPIESPKDACLKKNENMDENHLVLAQDIGCVNLVNESLDEDKRENEVEETVVNVSLNEVIASEDCNQSLKRSRDLRSPSPAPAKIRKLEEVEKANESCEENKRNFNEVPLQNEKKCRLDEEDDMEVYEVPTQVDELEIKTEKNSLNYSVTEELIEISDSEEEDWSLKNIEEKKWNDLLEREEEDDEVVFIERVIKPNNSNDILSLVSKIKDDLTETDKKWLGKLLGVKSESGPLNESQLGEKIQSVETAEGEGEEDSVVPDESLASGEVPTSGEERFDFSTSARVLETPLCFVKLHRILPGDLQLDELGKTAKSFREQEKPVRKPPSKKRVRFDLNPKVKYFEVPERIKLTSIEKGILRFTKVIYNICNWNTVWLEECKRISSEKDPPDICDEPLRKIPKKFMSHAEYISSYVPVMLLYLWNKVKDKWKNFGNTAFKQTLSCDSYEDYNMENMCVYKCTGLVQSVEAHRQLVREGHLVMLRLHSIRDANSTVAPSKYSRQVGYLVFGYLETKAYERFRDQPVHKVLGERCSSARGDLHLVRLTILVKKRPRLEIDQQKLMQMTVVQHISSEIRIFRAICFLSQSPLSRAILKPSKAKFALTAPPEKTNVFFTGPLDVHQEELVSNLTYTISSTKSFLYSIHGAAGTGKGQVVIAFILELLCGKASKEKERPKILYCAPSDGPLDEMVARLKSYRESLGTSRFSMVRVGSLKQVRPEVRDIALSNLTQKYRCSEKAMKEGAKEDLESEILKESDVICATCSSTALNKMLSVFDKMLHRNRDKKIICIIDEAMNIREPDSLSPLLLGVTHLLLVGDIYQLEPPFSGEKTHSLGLDMTLFWRIYKNFGYTSKDLWPISILKTQFRMNPGLSRFVGKVIYNTVQRDSVVSASHKISSLRSYLVIVDEAPDVDADPKDRKNREGRIILELVKAVMKITKEGVKKALNLSVITSDSKQTEAIKSFLPRREFPEVEINEVGKFQGRETDVVLFPCDGTKILACQTAVATTRARSSLLVVTTQRSITSNPWFQRLSEVAKEKEALKHVHPDSGPEVFERMLVE